MLIRRAPHIDLHHADMIKFHDGFKLEYRLWVGRAPLPYRADGFLDTHTPFSVGCKYGQDMPTANAATLQIDMDTWDLERDTTKCRSMHVAIATHIRYVPLSESEPHSPH